MNLVLLGAPGAGKGTVAQELVAEFGVAHISTGDLLRAAVKGGTELGIQAKKYMDAGELVPDQLVIDLVKERLAADDAQQGFILDGFPRNTAQAVTLDSELSTMGREIDCALLVDVAPEVIIDRLSSRRTCRACGYTGTAADATCPKCAGEMYQRDDDKPETITVDFDEQPAVLGISNYPRIQLGAMRYTTDTSLIDRASELLKGKTFKRWYGYASYRAKANDMVGGCHSSIELDTANGAKLCDVSYDPGYEGNEGPGIYIMDGDVAYVMEGDQTELNDFMGQCIQDAYKQTCLPDPQTARDSGSARTWLFEDEMPWTVESGSTGSAKE